MNFHSMCPMILINVQAVLPSTVFLVGALWLKLEWVGLVTCDYSLSRTIGQGSWSREGMLDGQQRRADMPAQARTAHSGLQQERLEDRGSLLNHASCLPDDPTGQWTELNFICMVVLEESLCLAGYTRCSRHGESRWRQELATSKKILGVLHASAYRPESQS